MLSNFKDGKAVVIYSQSSVEGKKKKLKREIRGRKRAQRVHRDRKIL